MVGHSKWSKVKRSKGPLDVKRGAAFSKLVKEITVASRLGGGDWSGHRRPRPCIETTGAATDNKNRTAADLRFILSQNHGSLTADIRVLYQFHTKGRITIPCPLTDEDRIPGRTLDAGAAGIAPGARVTA